MKTPKNIQELREQKAAGLPLHYRFFLDYQPSHNGTLTNACLSQWWNCLFKVDGEYFPTAEHFMMYQKARLFGDHRIAAKILEVDHPFEAKMLGRAVHGYNEERWCEARFDLVVRGNIEKFSQNKPLLNYLLATNNDILAETSSTDPIWGTGCEADDEIATQPEKWPGLNLLGFALMQTRDFLKKCEPTVCAKVPA